jgi:hypothetical protein
MKYLHDTRTYGRTRKGTTRIGISAAAALIFVVAILVVAAAAYVYYPPTQQSAQRSTTSSINQQPTGAQSCNPTTAQQIETKVGPVAGGGTLSTPGANIFTLQAGQYSTIGGDNPGTTGSGTTTTVGSYPLNGLVMQFYATAAYPIWVQAYVSAGVNLQSTPYQLGVYAGVGQVTVQCIPSAANPNAYLWFVSAGLIESPSSAVGTGTGTSSMNDAVALVTSSTGASLTTATVAMPATTAVWTVNLNLLAFAHTGAGYPVDVFGSTNNLVQNYATNVVYGGANVGNVVFGTILVISTNDSSASFSLDAAAPYSLSMTPVTANTVTAGSLNYIVSGFTGCTPSTTTATTTCLSVPLDVSSTKSGGHTAITFTWIDMQQTAYNLAHLTTPALAAGYHAAGASFGLASLGGLTPTTGNDAGAPAVLLEQSYTTLQSN